MKKGFLVLFLASSMSLKGNDQLNACKQLLREKSYDECHACASSFVQNKNPDVKSYAYYLMGYSSRMTHQFGEAIKYYEESIEATPDPDEKAKILNNIIAILQYTNLHEYAIREADRAIESSETWGLVSRYNKAISLKALGRMNDALEVLEEGVQIAYEEKNHVYILRLWNLQAEMQMEAGIKADARYLLSKVIELSQQEPESEKKYGSTRAKEQGIAWHQLGNMDLSEGDSAAALLSYQKALEVQPDDQERFYTLMKLAEVSEDRRYAEAALELYPELTRTGKSIEVFFLAAALNMGDPKYAHREYKEHLSEIERTERAYASYIGRMILQEQAAAEKRKEQERILWIMSFLVVSIAGYVFYRKKRAKQKIDSLLLSVSI